MADLTTSRRRFIGAGALLLGSPLTSTADASASQNARDWPEAGSVKALVFDVFGTVVDWRSSVARQVTELAKRRGVAVDGARFADAWRAEYAPSMNRVRTGELPWTRLDDLHRMVLDRLVMEYGLGALTDAELTSLNRAWHRLQPWPDVVSGLTKLKTRFIIAPLSNGNIALMTNLARYAKLPWDCILGAELVRHYKPDREVYESAASILDLQRSEVMMVAAHLGDLRAAKALGLRTAFVARPREFGPSRTPDLEPDSSVDVSARDFNDLARRLGA
jgi:2-haloacid dehalogenase